MRVLVGSIVVFFLSSAVFAQPRTSVSALIAEALEKNPDIAVAQRRYDAARQRSVQERSLPDPMLSTRCNASGSPVPAAGLETEPTANIGFMVSPELPYPGKLDLKAQIASGEAKAEEPAIEAARLSVVSRVKHACYRRAYTDAAGDLLARNRDLLDTLLKVSENRYAVGQAAVGRHQGADAAQHSRAAARTRPPGAGFGRSRSERAPRPRRLGVHRPARRPGVRCPRTVTAALTALLLAIALTMGSALEARASAGAMACCANARGQGAGLESADDCCARMSHAAPSVAAVLAPVHAAPVAVAISAPFAGSRSTRSSRLPASSVRTIRPICTRPRC